MSQDEAIEFAQELASGQEEVSAVASEYARLVDEGELTFYELGKGLAAMMSTMPQSTLVIMAVMYMLNEVNGVRSVDLTDVDIMKELGLGD